MALSGTDTHGPGCCMSERHTILSCSGQKPIIVVMRSVFWLSSGTEAQRCCRYVYENKMLQAVRASPGVKAATLSRESQALTHAVRMQLDSQCMQGDAEVRST